MKLFQDGHFCILFPDGYTVNTLCPSSFSCFFLFSMKFRIQFNAVIESAWPGGLCVYVSVHVCVSGWVGVDMRV